MLNYVDLGCARVWCTDRLGGSSGAPYDSLNLATHVGDDPITVRRNTHLLAALCEGTPADPDAWVYVNHLHGAVVLRLVEPVGGRPDADGAATSVVGMPLVAIGADCAPIAIANDSACAAIHSGWRGLEAGVIREGVKAVKELGTGVIRALIGPCISPTNYGFGEADLLQLASVVGPSIIGRTLSGAPALDLRSGIRSALIDAGVLEILNDDRCTFEDSRLFSFRRDGITGRQGMVVERVR